MIWSYCSCATQREHILWQDLWLVLTRITTEQEVDCRWEVFHASTSHFFLHNRNTWLILINDFINCTQSVMTETISYCLGCCACFVCVCLKLLCNKVRAYTTWVGCLWQTTLDCNYYPNLSNAHKQTCMDRHTLANKQWAQTHMLAPAHGLINQQTHTHIYPAPVAAYPRVTAHWEKETLFGFSRAEHITHNRQQWLFL